MEKMFGHIGTMNMEKEFPTISLQKGFGKNLHPLYLEWKASFQRYEQEIDSIRQEGVSVFDLISPKEQNCMGGSLSPDGKKLIFACSDLYKGANIYISNPDGSDLEIEVPNAFGRDFTWRSDSQAYAYSAIRSVNRYNFIPMSIYETWVVEEMF